MMFLLSLAFAQDLRLAERLGQDTEGGFGLPEDLVTTSDGAWVAFSTGGDSIILLDTGTWLTTEVTACTTTRGIAVADSTNGYTFFTGCGDGTIAVIDVTTSGTASLGTPLTAGAEPVYGVETDGSYLYAVYGADSVYQVNAFDLATDSIVSNFPVSISLSSVEDTLLVDGLLIGVDGDATFAKLDLETYVASTTIADVTYMQFVDAWNYNDTKIYFADQAGSFGYIVPTNTLYQSIVSQEPTVTAVGIAKDESYFVASTAEETYIYAFEDGYTGSELNTITGAGEVTEFVALDGYMLGGTQAGEVVVLTDRPWVTVAGVSPSSGVAGTEATITFSADTSGDYAVWMGGTVDAPTTQVAEGEVVAGETESVDFTVDSSFIEGKNRIWVFVTSNLGLEGHSAGVLTVNNPPGSVDLSGGIGESSVTLYFEALTDEDVTRYDLYLTTTAFSASDWESGGPEFDGPDAVALDAIEATPGASTTYTISPLTNGVTYYAAVRAVDSSGLEGPMSNVVAVTPEHTLTAAQLAGDDGGFCATSSRLSGVVVVAGMLLAGLRRRGVGMLGVLALVGVSGDALAGERNEDETGKTSQVSARIGPVNMSDASLDAVYGSRNMQMLRLDYGVAKSWGELDIGVGLVRKTGDQVTASGAVADEYVMLTLLPITMNVTGKLDFFHEQPVVPFARVGLDMWMWREAWGTPGVDVAIPYDSVGGGKYGWHYALGGMFLLDVLDREAANKMDALSGINDTFLIVEYRQSRMISKSGLDFSGSEISFGLKFDF